MKPASLLSILKNLISRIRVVVVIDIIVFVFLLLPIGVVVISSFTASTSLNFPPQGLSLQWYARVLSLLANDPNAGKAGLLNSIIFSVTLATIVVIISSIAGLLCAYGFVKYSFPGKNFLEQYINLPLIYPLVITGVSLLILFNAINFYFPLIMLVIGHVIVTIPYAFRNDVAVLRTIDPSFEEASMSLGANGITTFRRITLPLAKFGVFAGALFAFLISFDMFTVTFFLYNAVFKPYPMWLYEYVVVGMDPTLGALSTMIIGVDLIIMLALDRIVGIQKVVL